MVKLIIDDIEASAFLLQAPKLAVDIESDTTPPSEEWSADFGLSYVADIICVSLYDGINPPVVLNMPRVTGSVKGAEADLNHPFVKFLRDVLSREKIMIIGHNVVFDLRSLCGHYGFELAGSALVWDTQVISIRTLMSSGTDGGFNLHYGSSLDALTTRFGRKTYFSPNEDTFYKYMKKTFRMDFSKLEGVLETELGFDEGVFSELLPEGSPSTTEYKQLSDSAAAELRKLTSKHLIAVYVALDSVYTYQLYLSQSVYITSVVKQDTKYFDIFQPKWETLLELVKWEARISRTSVNQAARGMKLDTAYANKKLAEYQTQYEELLVQVVGLEDPSGNSVQWQTDFSLRWRINRLLAAVAGGTHTPLGVFVYALQTVTRSEVEGIVQQLGWSSLPITLTNSDEDVAYKANLVTTWTDFLYDMISNPLFKRNELTKRKPTLLPPDPVPLEEWVYEGGYFEGKEQGKYLASLKFNYFNDLLTNRQPVSPEKLLNKKTFKPYHLFVICAVPFPTDEQIHYNWSLVTPKTLNEGSESFKDRDSSFVAPTFTYMPEGEDDDTYSDFLDDESIIQPLSSYPSYRETAFLRDGWSVSTKALNYYLPPRYLANDEVNPDFESHIGHYYRLFLELGFYIARCKEMLLHSQRDGRIHSTVSRVTNTGRFSSRNPNLQNIKMSVFKGFLIADEGFVSIEADYSNAENVMAAVMSGDNGLAKSVESLDFHSAMAASYWPSEWAELERTDNVKGKAALRNTGKTITFGGAYGAGKNKIAVMVGCSVEEAGAILKASETSYPVLAKAKKQVGEAYYQRAVSRISPPFTTLWSGARSTPKYFVAGGDGVYNAETLLLVKGSGYKLWNYRLQGGVAELISRSIVLFSEWCTSENVKSYIAINIHDSIILSLKIEEADIVLPKLFEIMGDVMGEDLRHSTQPFVHFVSDSGPENAFKWGWSESGEYPLSLTHFWNRWGKFELPQSELDKPAHKRKTPTWRVNEAAGETVESEYQQAMQKEKAETVGAVVEINTRWAILVEEYDKAVDLAGKYASVALDLAFMKASYTLSYKTESGAVREVGPLNFVNFMNAVDHLVLKGYSRRELTTLPTWEDLVKYLRP